MGLLLARWRLGRLGLEGFRRHLEQSYEQLLALGWTPRDPYEAPALPKTDHERHGQRITAEMRDHFLETGEDRFELSREEAGAIKGKGLQNILRQRTGEEMPKPPAFEAALTQARESLGAGWR